MSTGVLAEASTVPSGSFVENLFRSLPSDARFKQITYQKITPRTAIGPEVTQIAFDLPRLDSPNCYYIQNILIQCTVQIETKAGKLPAKTIKIAPINNMLSSLFRSCSMKINDAVISVPGSHYGYKGELFLLYRYYL